MDRVDVETPRPDPAGGPESSPTPSGEPERPTLTQAIRNRLIGGLVFALPIAITFSIVYWVLVTIQDYILDPLAWLTAQLLAHYRMDSALGNLPPRLYDIASRLLAVFLAIVTLYFLGLALRSWVYQLVEWVMMRLPVVNTIYRTMRDVVVSLSGQIQSGAAFKRVVLVEFPHPGMRSLGLVSSSIRDVATGRTILTVYVMTGVVPPAGFTLLVPEESVTNIAWTVNETLQTILSAGMTTPPTIHYTEGLREPIHVGGGPIVDAHGKVLTTVDEGAGA